jgi:hypothetical protein
MTKTGLEQIVEWCYEKMNNQQMIITRGLANGNEESRITTYEECADKAKSLLAEEQSQSLIAHSELWHMAADLSGIVELHDPNNEILEKCDEVLAASRFTSKPQAADSRPVADGVLCDKIRDIIELALEREALTYYEKQHYAEILATLSKYRPVKPVPQAYNTCTGCASSLPCIGCAKPDTTPIKGRIEFVEDEVKIAPCPDYMKPKRITPAPSGAADGKTGGK